MKINCVISTRVHLGGMMWPRSFFRPSHGGLRNLTRHGHHRYFSKRSPSVCGDSKLGLAVRKAWNDRAQFQTWNTTGVFAPKLMLFQKVRMFCYLHLHDIISPTAYNIPEFLIGAQNAFELLLPQLTSRSVLARQWDDDKLWIYEMLTPEGIGSLKKAVRFLENVNRFMNRGDTEVEIYGIDNFEVHKCFLKDVFFTEDKQRLIVNVEVHATVLNCFRLRDEDGCIEEMSNQKKRTFVWGFESHSLQKPDWKIAKIEFF
jgi:hypothetical protein